MSTGKQQVELRSQRVGRPGKKRKRRVRTGKPVHYEQTVMELSSRPCTLGAEARDILMGQLFGVAALVRAMAARMAAGEMSSADAITFGAVVAEEAGASTRPLLIST